MGEFDDGFESLNRPEPPPGPGSGRPIIWDLVRSDVEQRFEDGPVRARFLRFAKERDEHGLRHYGTRLRAGNGRNPLIDAIQEAGDQTVYLRQALEEGYPVEEAYRNAVTQCMHLIAIHMQFETGPKRA
jgi:hypothetical protein